MVDVRTRLMGRALRAGGLRAVAAVGALSLVASGCAIARVSVSSTGRDTNGKPDVFRHDTTNGATVRIDVAGNSSQLPGGADDGALSETGRYAAFVTPDGLVAGDTNGDLDVYVRDLVAGATTWVSQPPPGGFPAGGVLSRADENQVAISGDGRYVTFGW
jgi:hypothetical protein